MTPGGAPVQLTRSTTDAVQAESYFPDVERFLYKGKNDPRVLKQESDDIVAALKARGVPVEYIVVDREGHGFVNKANEIRGDKAILDFLDKYLALSAS